MACATVPTLSLLSRAPAFIEAMPFHHVDVAKSIACRYGSTEPALRGAE